MTAPNISLPDSIRALIQKAETYILLPPLELAGLRQTIEVEPETKRQYGEDAPATLWHKLQKLRYLRMNRNISDPGLAELEIDALLKTKLLGVFAEIRQLTETLIESELITGLLAEIQARRTDDARLPAIAKSKLKQYLDAHKQRESRLKILNEIYQDSSNFINLERLIERLRPAAEAKFKKEIEEKRERMKLGQEVEAKRHEIAPGEVAPPPSELSADEAALLGPKTTRR